MEATQVWGGFVLFKLKMKVCLLTENYWEEGKNKAGTGQGEEDVGKSRRKIWTGRSISLSIARCSLCL